MRALVPWIIAWVLSLALLGALGWAGLHFRAAVVRLWPASQRLYAVLGPAKDGNLPDGNPPDGNPPDGNPPGGNPPVTSAH
jgi:hypothetical protein